MGNFNYYRNFIPNFPEIAKNIVELTKKGVKFKWTMERQVAFETLKDYLTKSPILIYPDPNMTYYLFTDASKYTWSAILMQSMTHPLRMEIFVLSYIQLHFRVAPLRGSQLNWATMKKEAYAIYMAFQKYSHYLEVATTLLRSDHAPLRKFLAGKTLNNTVNNWGIELSSFQIFFQHIKGKHNVMADTLSRLKRKGLYEAQDLEPEGVEFGHTILETLPQANINQVHVTDAIMLPVPVQGC